MTLKGKDTTKSKAGSKSGHRNYPTPAPSQNISIQPSKNFVSKHVPEYMISVRVKAMLTESDRYKRSGASADKVGELCMNVLPLGPKDKFPQRLAIILETDGPIAVVGKPCPRDSLKSSPFCQKCKRALNA